MKAKATCKTISLPKGHKWEEVDSGCASVVCFECDCGALFTHDLTDNSVEYEEGEEHE